jgi:hypothetical protein
MKVINFSNHLKTCEPYWLTTLSYLRRSFINFKHCILFRSCRRAFEQEELSQDHHREAARSLTFFLSKAITSAYPTIIRIFAL